MAKMQNIGSTSDKRPFPFKKARSQLRRLLGNRRGAVAVTTGLSLTAIVGAAGLAVDVGRWQTHHSTEQAAADNAAFSAAVAAHNGGGAPATNAKGVAAGMGFADGAQDGTTVTVNNPPTQGRYAGNADAWEVVISQPQKMWLASLYLSAAPVATARAVAHAQASNTPYCVLALHPSASQSALVQDSSAVVDLSNCSMQVNSRNSTAFDVNGGSFTADTVSVTGNKTVSANSTFQVNNVDAPGAQPIPDPYSGLTVPSYSCGGGGGHNQNIAAGNVPAGAYCNGMTFNGNSNQHFTLSGTYIVSGSHSTFAVQAGATVTSGAGGATIILTNGASVNINGGTTNLTAPTTGSYAGIVFYQDRSDTQLATLLGGGSQSFTGALYFPSATLKYGGSSGASACTQIIANIIVFSGHSTTSDNCTGTGVIDITSYPTVLAE